MSAFFDKPSNKDDTCAVKLEYDKNNVMHLDEVPEIEFDMRMTSVNDKYYKYVTRMCRRTPEYRDFIYFMKHNLDINHCSFYEGYSIKDGYIIELHHAPFTLYDYVETVCTKQMAQQGWVETMKICEEVIALHFKFMVGLTPLNPTAHELVHSDALPVHPKIIIGDWKAFYGEYNAWVSESVVRKYDEAIALEKKHDSPELPKILEYAPVTLDAGLIKLTEGDLDKLIIQSKISLLEHNQELLKLEQK